jgi:formate hydrogenlyase subunit 3/multisubunit Na+/H+ antiporter MnhD subunit
MNGPAIVIVSGLVAAGGLSLLHDRRIASSILATVICAGLALFVLVAPLGEARLFLGAGWKVGESFQLLGRELVLEDLNMAALAFLFFSGAVIFAGGWVAPTARYLFSAGMLTLVSLGASMMVQPFLFSAIFIIGAALSAVLILADPLNPAIDGTLRLLSLYTVAMAAILIAGWMLETSGVSLGSPALAQDVGRVLALGFAILLAVPPFHIWLLPAARRSDSYGLAFLAIGFQSVGFLLMLRFFNNYEWLRALPIVSRAVEAAGGLMIIIGGLGLLAEHHLGRAMVYALLIDFGGALLAVSLLRPAGFNLGLSIMAARTFSLSLAGLGLAALRQSSVSLGRENVQGAAYTNPLVASAILLGLLALTGAPMTAGFPGRWATISLLVDIRPVASVLVVLGILAGIVAAARWLSWLLANPGAAPTTVELGREGKGFLFASIFISPLLSIFPQVFQPWILEALSGLENLV